MKTKAEGEEEGRKNSGNWRGIEEMTEIARGESVRRERIRRRMKRIRAKKNKVPTEEGKRRGTGTEGVVSAVHCVQCCNTDSRFRAN